MDRFDILRLGHRGDGIAEKNGKTLFIAGALPGESVRAEGPDDRLELIEVLKASPQRITPVCPAFLACGGCAVQHLEEPAYRAWKRGIVVTALEQAGLDAPVDDLVDAHGVGRRRLTLHLRREGRGWTVGFLRARSHELIALDACPVLAPGLQGVFALGRALSQHLTATAKEADLALTLTETGIDADLQGVKGLNEPERLALIAFAQQAGLARLTLSRHLLVESRAPSIKAGAVAVRLPPAAFLQATQAGEETLAALVLQGLGKAKTVVDLFCGLGTFALRISEKAAVTAYDSDEAAINALIQAARFKPQGTKAVKAEARDLFRRPLRAEELKGVDAVVMDPARAGAEAQAKNLARAKLKTIVSVSCNPATFARDAKILVDAGWRLERVTPVDQFRHTDHVELVGVLRR